MKFPALFIAIVLCILSIPAGASDKNPKRDKTTGWSVAEANDTAAQEFNDVASLYAEDEEDIISIADPISPFNRLMFHFNDKLYFWILKPAARGYKAVVPTPARTGVKNFFNNLAAPVRTVNALLQGKGRVAVSELARFVLNSTIGILGFGNPAQKYPEYNPPEEDLGQSLGHYGIGNGFYVVWPLLGPSSLRDTVGTIGDSFLDPLDYVDPWEVSAGAMGLDIINDTSFRIGDYEAMKDAAIDPYESLKSAYIRGRALKVEE